MHLLEKAGGPILKGKDESVSIYQKISNTFPKIVPIKKS